MSVPIPLSVRLPLMLCEQTNVETLGAFADENTAFQYANRIIQRVGPTSGTLSCDLCQRPGTALWRCDSCQRERDLCTPCMRLRHMSDPYHRVRYLTPTTGQYREAWLRDAGVFIQLCPRARGTSMCPGYDSTKHLLNSSVDSNPPPYYGRLGMASRRPEKESTSARGPDPAGPAETRSLDGSQILVGSADDPDEEALTENADVEKMDEGEVEAQLLDADEEEQDGEPEGDARKRGREATIQKDHWGFPVMVIVHQVDIHQLGVAYCKCSDGGKHIKHDEQLISLGGLFPATQKEPSTCFTLQGLAYHQVDRLECKVAPEAIMRKMQRQTSPMHSKTVPVSWFHTACYIRLPISAEPISRVITCHARVHSDRQSYRTRLCAPAP